MVYGFKSLRVGVDWFRLSFYVWCLASVGLLVEVGLLFLI